MPSLFFPALDSQLVHAIECRPQESKRGAQRHDIATNRTHIYLMVFPSCRICAQYSGLAPYLSTRALLKVSTAANATANTAGGVHQREIPPDV